MDSKLMNHVLSYEDIYRYVSEKERTEEDLRTYLENQGKAESTVRTFINKITKKDDPGLFALRNGLIVIDDVKGRKLVDDLREILSLPSDDEILSNALREVDSLKKQLEEKQKQFEEKRQVLEQEHAEELQDQKEQISMLQDQMRARKKEITKLKRERNKLEKQLSAKRDFVYQSINQKVLIRDSVEIGPLRDAEESALLCDVGFLIDIEKPELQEGVIRNSFYEEIPSDLHPVIPGDGKEAGKELCEKNHKRKSMRRILTDLLLKKRVEEAKEVIEIKESEQEKKTELITEKVKPVVDNFRMQRLSYIQSIVNNKQMTNQEKLALYAFYSDFHGKDMERLINYAGDECINANLLIQLLESPGKNCTLENAENMLRQFAKASQVRIKLDFAKELIAGDWYIVADYNGVKTKFQLVPLEEFNELRVAMGLPVSDFYYGKQAMDKKEKNVQKKTDAIKKPEIKRFNCLEDAEEDIPDQNREGITNEEGNVNGK